MASVVTVKLSYDDNSKSYQESFNAADSHPSAEVIKDCENAVVKKWEEMGGTWRGLRIHTTIKQT